MSITLYFRFNAHARSFDCASAQLPTCTHRACCIQYSSEMCVGFIPVVRIHFYPIRKFHFRCNTGPFYQDTTPHDNIVVQYNSITNTRIMEKSENRMSRWINDRPICILQSQWGNRARNSNRTIFWFRVTLWTFHYDFPRRSLVMQRMVLVRQFRMQLSATGIWNRPYLVLTLFQILLSS